MIQIAEFSEKPQVVQICRLPEGGTDVWLRQNVSHVQLPQEGTEENQAGGEKWTADEAYMRTQEAVTAEEIQADFAAWWEAAAAAGQEEEKPSIEDRVTAVEAAMVEILMGGEVGV